MIRVLGILLVSTSAAAANYCPESTFYEEFSSTIDDGSYHVGHTAGYRIDDQGVYLFRRCVVNWSSTGVQFKWAGPRPNPIFKGRIARSTNPDGRAQVEEWKRSTSGAEDDLRTLQLSLDGSNFDGYQVDTWFEKAAREQPHVRLVQSTPFGFDLSSYSSFISELPSIVANSNRERFRLSSGIRFSVPANEAIWENYLFGVDQESDDLVQVQVVVGVEYDPTTLEVNFDASIGFDGRAVEIGLIDRLAPALSVDLNGLGELGLSIPGSFQLEDADFEGVGAGFFGRQIQFTAGSLSDRVTDETALRIEDVPISVRLDEEEIFQFHLEVIAVATDT